MFLFVVLFASSLLYERVTSNNDSRKNSCKTVTFLHIIPSSKNEELSGWNESELHLLYRARDLALKYINNSTDILSGLTLNSIDISTDDCAKEDAAILQDLVETFSHVSKNRCLVGIVGLYCSKVTRVLGTHLSHPKFGYLQLSSSTSPLLQNKEKFPHLFRLVASSVLFNKAVLKMMDEFHWKNISLIYDFSDVFFRSTAINFARQVEDRTDLNLLAFFPIRSSGRHEVLADIVKTGSRVTYFSVTHKESSDVLCDAYHHNFFWPNHVYIFVDDSLEEILASNYKCTKSELLQAAEGTILLLNRLSNFNSDLHSDNYYEKYSTEIDSSSGGHLGGTMLSYADVLYDQIWALAFALNDSVNELHVNLNDSLESHIKQSSQVRNILVQKLKNVYFTGATGKVKFNKNQEVLTMIDIYQVKNGSQVLIGEFNTHTGNLTFNNNFEQDRVPEDSFEVRHDAIPLWLGVMVALFQGLLLVLFTITSVYIIYRRSAPEIKSTSLRVSIFILSGCMMVILSSLFFNLENFSNASDISVTAFCNLESLLFLYGINITLVALFFRLLRVFVIFHYPKTRIMMLADKHLVTYIIITSLAPLIFLIIWMSCDHLTQRSTVKFVYSEMDPHYTEHYYCSCQHIDVWTGLYYSWIALLLLILLILAIQTRHVRFRDFKDTKKITAFISVICFMLGSLLPMSYLLQKDDPVGFYILKSLITLFIPLACLSFQYFPKLFPILSQRRKSSLISTNLSFITSKLSKATIDVE